MQETNNGQVVVATEESNVQLIVGALREQHLAHSKALVTIGEIASEEIRSRQGKADASYGHICKVLQEDVRAAGGFGFDPSYLSRALASYAIANLLTDIDLVQQVPAYALKVLSPFVKRVEEAPADSPFNPTVELVYAWKEDKLADISREFLTGVRDGTITFLGAGDWMKKALADRQCETTSGKSGLNNSTPRTPKGKVASGWKAALCTEVKNEKTGKVDNARTRKLCRDGIQAAAQGGVLTLGDLLVAITALAAKQLGDGEDTLLGTWEKIAAVANQKVDEYTDDSELAEASDDADDDTSDDTDDAELETAEA